MQVTYLPKMEKSGYNVFILWLFSPLSWNKVLHNVHYQSSKVKTNLGMLDSFREQIIWLRNDPKHIIQYFGKKTTITQTTSLLPLHNSKSTKKNVKSAETEDRTQYLRLMRASLYRVSYFGTKINFKGSSGLRGSNTVPQDNLAPKNHLQNSLGFQLQSRALPSELSPEKLL